MPVGVNVRSLSHRMTGVERYTREVVDRLMDRVRLLAPRRPLDRAVGHLWEQYRLPSLLHSREMLWSPANTGPLSVRNQVITLHDASFIDHPDWFEANFAAWYGFLLPRLVRQVPLILTISIFSKIRILEAFRISEQQVKVVPGGVNLESFRPVDYEDQARTRAKYKLQKPYILTVGSISERKNLHRLLAAWMRVGGPGDIDLVWVGDEGAAFRKVHVELQSENVRFIGRVDDQDLAALYSAALAYVTPSLYEGFGLTVLEAMACGAPVIASNEAALPEVVGSAGLLVDPYDVDALAWAIFRIVEDSALREDLIRRGFERVREYPWDRTAQDIWTSILEVHPYKGLNMLSTYGR